MESAAPTPLATPPSDALQEKRTAGDLIEGLFARYAIGWLILLLAMMFAFAVICSHAKHFWYDELFTVIVASQPTLHQFAQAMPVEGNPPMNTLLVRSCIHLLGLSEFSVRLPAMLGFCAALAGLFVFVRRERGAVFGLLAVAIMAAQPAWTFSFEARPYGLLLGFMMLALVSWQSAIRSADATPAKPRMLALAGMALGIAGCIFSHPVGVVEVGAPLLFGEAVRAVRHRRLDWPLILTGVLPALAALAITLPMAYRTKASTLAYLPLRKGRSLLSDWSFVKVTLPAILSARLTLFLVLVVVVSWFLNRLLLNDAEKVPHAAPLGVPAHILSASLGTALLIPITWLVMMSQNGYYFGRYGIGSVAGIAMLTCFLFERGRIRGGMPAVGLFLLCSFLMVKAFIKEHRRLSQPSPVEQIAYDDRSSLPMVISAPLEYPATWWYAPRPVKYRMVYLTNRPGPHRWGFELLEACLVWEKSMFAAPLQDYRAFTATHDHFLLETGPIDDSLQGVLEADGYRATLLRGNDVAAVYDMRQVSAKR